MFQLEYLDGICGLPWIWWPEWTTWKRKNLALEGVLENVPVIDIFSFEPFPWPIFSETKTEIGGEMRENVSCFFPITAVTHKTLKAEEIELAVWRLSLPADVPVDLWGCGPALMSCNTILTNSNTLGSFSWPFFLFYTVTLLPPPPFFCPLKILLEICCITCR